MNGWKKADYSVFFIPFVYVLLTTNSIWKARKDQISHYGSVLY